MTKETRIPGDTDGGMDKYAVVVDDEMTKTSEVGQADCPSCGSTNVDYTSNVPVCPVCGTLPWEPPVGD